MTVWKVEFYDSTNIYFYEGNRGILTFVKKQPHLFTYCPLQLIPNNREMLGDAEKVLTLIDAYDKDLSDCDNDIESFARAMLVFEISVLQRNKWKKRKRQAYSDFSVVLRTAKHTI